MVAERHSKQRRIPAFCNQRRSVNIIYDVIKSNFSCYARPHQELGVLARDVWSVICTVQWETDCYN